MSDLPEGFKKTTKTTTSGVAGIKSSYGGLGEQRKSSGGYVSSAARRAAAKRAKELEEAGFKKEAVEKVTEPPKPAPIVKKQDVLPPVVKESYQITTSLEKMLSLRIPTGYETESMRKEISRVPEPLGHIQRSVLEPIVSGATLALPSLPYFTYSVATKPVETGKAVVKEFQERPVSSVFSMVGASAVFGAIKMPSIREPSFKVTAVRGVETETSIYQFVKGLPTKAELDYAKLVSKESGKLKEQVFSPTELKKTQKLITKREPGTYVVEKIKPDILTYKATKPPEISPEVIFRDIGKVKAEFMSVKGGQARRLLTEREYFKGFEEPSIKETILTRKPGKPRPILTELYKKEPPKTAVNFKFPEPKPVIKGGGRTRLRLEEKPQPLREMQIPIEFEEIPAIVPKGMPLPALGAASLSRQLIKPIQKPSLRIRQQPRLRLREGIREIQRPRDIEIPRLFSIIRPRQKVIEKPKESLEFKPRLESMFRPSPRPRGIGKPAPPPFLGGSSKFLKRKKTPSLRPKRFKPRSAFKPPKLTGFQEPKRTGLSDVVFSSARRYPKVEPAAGFFRIKRRRK